MNRVNVNEQVAVTVMGFKKDLSAYPRRMEFRGSTYDFIDAGVKCLVHYGGRFAEIITMSDGASTYCLRSENRGGNWTLVSITA